MRTSTARMCDEAIDQLAAQSLGLVMPPARVMRPLASNEVQWQGEVVKLNGQEMICLRLLLRSSGEPLPNSAFVEELWGHLPSGGPEGADNQAHVIRCTLGKKLPGLIKTEERPRRYYVSEASE